MQANVSQEEQLFEMTRKMLASAEAADWDQLAKLENSRLAIFNQVFSAGIAGKVELAKQILSLDNKTKQLAEARMPELRNELAMLNNSGKANLAYKSIQGLNSGDE